MVLLMQKRLTFVFTSKTFLVKTNNKIILTSKNNICMENCINCSIGILDMNVFTFSCSPAALTCANRLHVI